jgi:plasmid stabilization system protein ParE
MPSLPHYRVVLTADAAEELTAIGDFIKLDSPNRAIEVVRRPHKAIGDLQVMPARFPAARESGQVLADLRQRVEGPYRIIFELRKREVIVIGIRHAARRPMDLE